MLALSKYNQIWIKDFLEDSVHFQLVDDYFGIEVIGVGT